MDELKKQQVINDKVYNQKLMDDVVRLVFICIKCLDELLKEEVINEKVYDQKFMESFSKEAGLEVSSGKHGSGWWADNRQGNRWSNWSWLRPFKI